MYRCITTKVKVLLFVTLFILPLSTATAQGLQSKLAQRVSAFDSESSTTVGQLIDFAQRFQIPMGIEWLEKAEEGVAPPIHARNTTAQHILQQIVQQKSGNGFALRDGVVHVFSSSIINDERNFLNLRVPHFQVKNDTLFGAEFLLRVSIHQVLNPGRGGGYGGGHGHGVPRSDTFDVRNVNFSAESASVRQILNSIAVHQRNALWVVRLKQSQMMSNGRFYAQSASAMGKEPAPDFHWDFIPLRDLAK